MPKLTIITVNYNNEAGLKRTLESVFAQTDQSFESIVIDGNSTDSSRSILEAFDSQITQWTSEPDTGVYDAMNKGIAKATGEYVLFLNSGDHFYDSNSLTTILNNVAGTDIISFDINMVLNDTSFIKKHPDTLTFQFLFENTFAHQSTVIKRTLFKAVGRYDTSLQIVADWKFFVDALVYHQASYKAVHEVITTYYLDGISATGKGSNIRKMERRKILNSEYALFVEDYSKLRFLDTNRFQILTTLEQNKFTRKLSSMYLHLMYFLYRGKQFKSLDRKRLQ